MAGGVTQRSGGATVAFPSRALSRARSGGEARRAEGRPDSSAATCGQRPRRAKPRAARRAGGGPYAHPQAESLSARHCFSTVGASGVASAAPKRAESARRAARSARRGWPQARPQVARVRDPRAALWLICGWRGCHCLNYKADPIACGICPAAVYNRDRVMANHHIA